MYRKQLFFIFLFIFLSLDGFSQNKLLGTVIDSTDNGGLPGARIALLNQKDSILQQTVSQEGGNFVLDKVALGNYVLSVTFIGYKSRKIPISEKQFANPVKVVLVGDFTMLDAVTINVPPPPVVVKGDTTEFSASAFSTEAYADADALVGQLPGVELDADGNITAQGEPVQRIIVDGKEFFSSDPAVALKTLPADVIDKIQLIDEKSEQSKLTGFDDGNRRKIINIVTKPDRRHGYFGKMAGAVGDQSRYNTGGSLNAFNGDRRISTNLMSNNINQGSFSSSDLVGAGGRSGRGGSGGGGIGPNNRFSINYNNTWWEDVQFNVSYGLNASNKEQISSTNREVLIGNNANQLNQSSQQTRQKNQSHSINAKIEYKKDTTQKLVVIPNISFNSGNTMNTNSTRTLYAISQERINSSDRSNNGKNRAFTIGGSINYGIRLNNKGRSISAELQSNYNRNNNNAYALSYNLFYEGNELSRGDTVNNRNTNFSNSKSWNAQISYTEPLGLHSRMKADLSIRNNNSYSDRRMYDFLEETGQYSELNRLLSNEFRNDYRYYGSELSYQYSKETLQFELGLDYQNATMANDRLFPDQTHLDHRFENILPSANLTVRFSRDRRLRFNYNTSTNPPNVLQLQDVINNQDPLNITGGNPDLKQEFTHSFKINYRSVNRETGGNFSANLQASVVKNRIVNSTFIATQDTFIVDGVLLGTGAQFVKPINVNGYYNTSGNVSYGMPIPALKINVNTNTSLTHNREVGVLNDQETYTNTTGISQRVGINSKISSKIVFGLSYSGNYNMVRNSQNANLSNNSYNQTIRNDVTYIFWKGVRLASSLNYRYNAGLSAGYDQSFLLWNASIGKKLFKNEEGEVTLTAFDLLDNNAQVGREITERYIQDSQTNVLQRYFLLSFTYNLRSFGGKMGGGEGRRMGGEEGMGRRGGFGRD